MSLFYPTERHTHTHIHLLRNVNMLLYVYSILINISKSKFRSLIHNTTFLPSSPPQLGVNEIQPLLEGNVKCVSHIYLTLICSLYLNYALNFCGILYSRNWIYFYKYSLILFHLQLNCCQTLPSILYLGKLRHRGGIYGLPLISPAETEKKWPGNVQAEEALLSDIRIQYRLNQK